jgi:hypothetical protein
MAAADIGTSFTMEEVKALLEEAVLNSERKSATQLAELKTDFELTRQKALVDKLEFEAKMADMTKQSEVLVEAEYNVLMNKSFTFFPDPSLFSEDKSMMNKIIKDRDFHSRSSAAYHALSKEDPDVAFAKKIIGEGLRLSENAAASYGAALKVKQGLSRYTMVDNYYNLSRPSALATPSSEWTPSSVVQIDKTTEKAAVAQMEANDQKRPFSGSDFQRGGGKRQQYANNFLNPPSAPPGNSGPPPPPPYPRSPGFGGGGGGRGYGGGGRGYGGNGGNGNNR